MRIGDFDLYRELLARTSGLTLTPDKCYLLDSRLTPIAKRRGFATLEAMTLSLRGIQDAGLVKEIVEAMAMNETSFFRDRALFGHLQSEIIPFFLKARAGKKSLRVWSAACASGQEPYSVALILSEMQAQLKGWNIEILATDISETVLEQAKEAVYSQFEAQRGLPVRLLIKYFEQDGEDWRLRDEVRSMVRFQPFNLLNPMGKLGAFDIILCRNVLNNFDEQAKAGVLERIAAQLAPGGMLLAGISEHIAGPFRQAGSQAGLYVLQNSDYNMATG